MKVANVITKANLPRGNPGNVVARVVPVVRAPAPVIRRDGTPAVQKVADVKSQARKKQLANKPPGNNPIGKEVPSKAYGLN